MTFNIFKFYFERTEQLYIKCLFDVHIRFFIYSPVSAAQQLLHRQFLIADLN